MVSPRLLDNRPEAAPPARAEDGSEQQLVEMCTLMLLQRRFRELLLEEFVMTLHLVSIAAGRGARVLVPCSCCWVWWCGVQSAEH